MAAGDIASAAGYPLVPDTGEEGRVRWGAREINRTRDFVAEISAKVPTTSEQYRNTARIYYGNGMPGGGAEGDIFFRIL